MKLICQTNEFKNAIINAQRAVAIRSTMPILDGLLIEADQEIVMTGYDMEMGITCRIPAEIIKPGRIVMTAKMLADIARKLPDETVSIEVDDQETVTIVSGKSEFQIKGRSADTYPVMPEVARDHELTMSQAVLKNMIRQTIFAVSTDEQRRNLNGALLTSEGNTCEMVACDAFRLALRREVSAVELPNLQFIIHGKALRELMGILLDETAAVTMYTTMNHIKFNFGNVTMVSRLIQGEFMPYKSLIPDTGQTKVTVNTRKLQRAVERAMLLIESENLRYPVNFKTVNDRSLVVHETTNVGVLHEDIDIEMTGAPIDIDFNPTYFNDALKVIEDESIVISFNGQVGPCVMMPAEGDRFAYLVLPLRR